MVRPALLEKGPGTEPQTRGRTPRRHRPAGGDIVAATAERLGKAQAFTEGKSETDRLRSFQAAGVEQAATRGIAMPNVDRFRERGFVTFPVREPAEGFVRCAAFRDDPTLDRLGTASGLIEIVSRNIETTGCADCPPRPTWMEPVERAGAGAGARANSRLHLQLRGTTLRESYAVAGREPCLIDGEEAAARGIVRGDLVRILDDRGRAWPARSSPTTSDPARSASAATSTCSPSTAAPRASRRAMAATPVSSRSRPRLATRRRPTPGPRARRVPPGATGCAAAGRATRARSRSGPDRPAPARGRRPGS